jgi:hypothetical protein
MKKIKPKTDGWYSPWKSLKWADQTAFVQSNIKRFFFFSKCEIVSNL